MKKERVISKGTAMESNAERFFTKVNEGRCPDFCDIFHLWISMYYLINKFAI